MAGNAVSAEETRSLVESYVTEHPSLGTEFFDLISCSKPIFQEGKGVSLADMMRSYLKDNSVEDPEGFNWDIERERNG